MLVSTELWNRTCISLRNCLSSYLWMSEWNVEIVNNYWKYWIWWSFCEQLLKILNLVIMPQMTVTQWGKLGTVLKDPTQCSRSSWCSAPAMEANWKRNTDWIKNNFLEFFEMYWLVEFSHQLLALSDCWIVKQCGAYLAQHLMWWNTAMLYFFILLVVFCVVGGFQIQPLHSFCPS